MLKPSRIRAMLPRRFRRATSLPLALPAIILSVSISTHAQQSPPIVAQNNAPQDVSLSANTTATANPATAEAENATIVSVAPETPDEPEELGSEEVEKVAPKLSVAEQQIARARAFAAIRNYNGALQALEPLRATSNDATTAEVARVLLSSIYIEQADYKRAISLLEESFAARSKNNQAGAQNYFAVTRQALNGVRARLAHYRAYNVDTDDRLLPTEATNDLNGMRALLDSLLAQAEKLQTESTASVSSDSAALYEDAAGVRLSLARNAEEKSEWQSKLSEARQRLVAADAGAQATAAKTPNGANRFVAVKTVSGEFASEEKRTNEAKKTNAEAANVTPLRNPILTNAASPVEASKTSDKRATDNDAKARIGNAQVAERPSSTASETARLKSSAPPVAASNNLSSPTAAPVNLPLNNVPVEVGALTAKATNRAQPVYPSAARNAHLGGVVTVYVIVNEAGKIEKITSTTGPQLLRRAAEDAARRWRFTPTLVNNQPVRVSGFLSFNFTLEGK